MQFISANIDATIELMKMFLDHHQAELLVMNYSRFATVTARLSYLYKEGINRFVWCIANADTDLFSLPLFPEERARLSDLQQSQTDRPFKMIEVNPTDRYLMDQQTYQVIRSDFDIWCLDHPYLLN